MSQEGKGENNGKLDLVRALAREWGALLVVAAFGYWLAAIHSEDTHDTTTAIKELTAVSQQQNQKLDIIIQLWSGQKQSLVPNQIKQ